ncbi:uncharacterized protein LY89DRAFT_653320 [Mollisia scopiformis]|uniref:Uncharacterized protein n=1 Tax=Mollisia scopiformis TaxID=149040 RepID=A0A194WW85_MOLSC|nr:uncharacterized protein LY89DRAFT_653320 [Mollisia scopiformis]KUJ11847.1 hypothetical protein LY89DRAFT_653320 [Mollisia scopiformis]
MRSTYIISAFAGLALAAPHPQDIEFDQVDAAPDPTIVTPPVLGASATVSIQPTAAVATVADASVTEVASTNSTETNDKRDFLDFLGKRDGNCAVQPKGTGPTVNTPDDTPASFLAYQPFQTTATNAATPQGYTQSFVNLQGSSQTVSWLGYTTLSSYDTVACASYCDQLDGCQAFNIYYERDPTEDPNATSCPNPPSLTNIKCSRWGVQITADTAVNTGQNRDSFQVVIAGSNGYNKNAPPPAQTGFTGPVELGGAINAPNDPVTNTNTYMGYKFFSFGQVQTYPAGVQACTLACTAQTAYNSRHPPSTGKPNVCNQVVVYVLSDENDPKGIYCAMYSEEWAQNYATNYGQYRGSDYWSVSQAYAYTNATYSAAYGPICAVGGCPSGSYRGGNCGGWGTGNC